MIAIVDYGLGNLGSVANMLRKIGVEARITADPAQLREARGLILSGVGHYDEGMRQLRERGLTQVLTERVVEQKTPILGICLGMQLLGRKSEEGNIAAELVLPTAWAQGHFDWRYIQSVQRAYGSGSLDTFPHLNLPNYLLFQYWIMKRSFNILNLMVYEREQAISELESRVGWRNYGGKHYKSIYTRFFQGYVLPVKFGYDKRRAHQTSMILAGQQSREHALAILATSPYESEALLQQDRTFVLKKLGLSDEGFSKIMSAPRRSRADFASMLTTRSYRAARSLYRFARNIVPSVGGR